MTLSPDEAAVRMAMNTPADGAPAQKKPDIQPDIKPRSVVLPTGRTMDFFSREQLTFLYHCSHGELGRLLSRRLAPLPIRINEQIVWYVDEAVNMQAPVMRTLERWRRR